MIVDPRLVPGPLLLLTLVVMAAIALGTIASLAGWRVRQNRGTLAAAGVLGGALSTIAATPGPPVVVVYRADDPSRHRANLSLFFLTTTLVSLAVYAVSGDLGRGDLEVASWLVLGVGLGALVARVLVRRIPAGAIRPAALWLCLVSAVGLLGGALAG
nr:TSUP family transporter [Isoptericola chiayiensis]